MNAYQLQDALDALEKKTTAQMEKYFTSFKEAINDLLQVSICNFTNDINKEVAKIRKMICTTKNNETYDYSNKYLVIKPISDLKEQKEKCYKSDKSCFSEQSIKSNKRKVLNGAAMKSLKRVIEQEMRIAKNNTEKNKFFSQHAEKSLKIDESHFCKQSIESNKSEVLNGSAMKTLKRVIEQELSIAQNNSKKNGLSSENMSYDSDIFQLNRYATHSASNSPKEPVRKMTKINAEGTRYSNEDNTCCDKTFELKSYKPKPKSYKCIQCSYITNTSLQFNNHLIHVHNDPKNFTV